MALIATMLGSAGTASAVQLPGLQRVAATSATNSQSKSVTASCPFDYRVLNASGEITGGLGQVVLDDLTPNQSLTSVTATGFEDQSGTTASWSITAYAICARPIPGLGRVSHTSTPGSYTWTYDIWLCPHPRERLGIGADITGGVGEVSFAYLFSTSAIGVHSQAIEDQDGTSSNWSVNSYLICADQVAGQEIVIASSATDSLSSKSVTATCPPTKKVVGTGFEMWNLGVLAYEVVLDDLRPNATLTSVTATAFEDQDGWAGDWRIDAYAMCVFP
jgi:hypothetical protein